ncbi:NUDIX domain-containing protein [Streptomyces sp. NBC_01369]|uniref:NUDIX hydrolase n=1 Tax=unclassified Streptomyces TaxID=2593676 RepID=UPI0022538B3E|nr:MULTISPECIES: NUDIX domain-containing protein [unclassified Streptomyces]MCX4869742.1 NUDIX domain-containing protein [Streptomyces sp. NBC_00906]MCX4900905.1 NUDIX domain-containing protein [Streptomyces sp. NBC_00892]
MAEDQSYVKVDRGVEIPVPAGGEVWAVGAVILNRDGHAFAQKRSPDRRLFPDCWDIVGGHVESGESLLDTLAREVEEETGWRLRQVRRLLGIATWTGDDGDGTRQEADYLVEVDGDLDHPALEWSKHTAYGWFGPDDLPSPQGEPSPWRVPHSRPDCEGSARPLAGRRGEMWWRSWCGSGGCRTWRGKSSSGSCGGAVPARCVSGGR